MPRTDSGPHRLARGAVLALLVLAAGTSPAAAQLPDVDVADRVQVPDVQAPDVQLPGGGGAGGGGGGGATAPLPDVDTPGVNVPDVDEPSVPADRDGVQDVVGGVTGTVRDTVRDTVGETTKSVGETTKSVGETVKSVGGTVRETTKPVAGGGTSSGGPSSSDDDDSGDRRSSRPSGGGGSAGGSAPAGGPSRRAGSEREPGSLLGSVLGLSDRRAAVRGAGGSGGDDRRVATRGDAADDARERAGSRDGSGGFLGSVARAAGVAPAAVPAIALRTAAQRDAASGERSGVIGAIEDAIDTILRPLPDWSRPIIAALLLLLLAMGVRNWLRGRNIRQLSTERQTLTGDLAVLQQALVPPVPSELGGLLVSVAYRPAAGLAAGGDFYDAFMLDEHRVGLVLGDVSGHDRTSIPRAASVRHKLRAYLELGLEPRTVMRVAGEALADDSLDGDFTTAIVAVHDRRTGELTYAGAGHMPPIITGSGAHTPLLAGGSPPLGWGVPTGQRQTTVVLGQGSQACLFTDGLIEARKGDEQLGRERVEEMVAKLPGGPVAATALLEEIILHADRADDDLAALVVRAVDAPTVPVRRVEELEVDAGEAGVKRAVNVLRAWGLHDAAVDLAVSELEAHEHYGCRVLKLEYDADGEPVELNVEPRSATPALV